MTQPEQEAREMLAVKALSSDVEDARVLRLHFKEPVTGQDRSDILRAINAFARPTAGIDRVTLARAMNPALFDADPVVAHQAASPIIVEVAQRRAMTVAGEVLERLALPAPAKTGERGAVIEECLAAVRAVVRQQDADHGAANSGGAEAALEAIRALSQPLPGAPIVGEG